MLNRPLNTRSAGTTAPPLTGLPFNLLEQSLALVDTPLFDSLPSFSLNICLAFIGGIQMPLHARMTSVLKGGIRLSLWVVLLMLPELILNHLTRGLEAT
jgi:hypothetical protein